MAMWLGWKIGLLFITFHRAQLFYISFQTFELSAYSTKNQMWHNVVDSWVILVKHQVSRSSPDNNERPYSIWQTTTFKYTQWTLVVPQMCQHIYCRSIKLLVFFKPTKMQGVIQNNHSIDFVHISTDGYNSAFRTSATAFTCSIFRV